MSGNIIKPNGLTRIIPANYNVNSAWDMLSRSVDGYEKSVTKTLTTAAAPHLTNLFRFDGACNLNFIFGVFTDVTDIADMTACHFDIWDGTTSVKLTAAAGPALTGYGLGSYFLKDDVVANALIGLNNDQVRIRETAVGTLLAPVKLSPKAGVDNYIRFGYTSASINVTIRFGLIYVPSVNYENVFAV